MFQFLLKFLYISLFPREEDRCRTRENVVECNFVGSNFFRTFDIVEKFKTGASLRAIKILNESEVFCPIVIHQIARSLKGLFVVIQIPKIK